MVFDISTHRCRITGWNIMISIQTSHMVLGVGGVLEAGLEVVKALACSLFGQLATLSVLRLVHKKTWFASFSMLKALSAPVDSIIHNSTSWNVVTERVHIRLFVSCLLVEILRSTMMSTVVSKVVRTSKSGHFSKALHITWVYSSD